MGRGLEGTQGLQASLVLSLWTKVPSVTLAAWQVPLVLLQVYTRDSVGSGGGGGTAPGTAVSRRAAPLPAPSTPNKVYIDPIPAFLIFI